QYRYSVGRQSPIYSTVAGAGFSTFELRLVNAGNTDEANLNIGKQNVAGNNSVVNQLWIQSLLTIKEANLVLTNLDLAPDAGVRVGLKSYATIFKSLALGTLASYFEQAAITIGEDQPFVDRTQALQEAVRLLQELEADLSSTAISVDFTRKALNTVDARNTLYALLARYQTILGNSDAALAAANQVSLTVRSFFRYDATNPNPIFNTSNNVLQPRNALLGLPAALAPDANDKRLDFYLVDKRAANVLFKGFFATADAAIPVYLPGEISLIKAEAYARKNQLTEAVTELNNVLTKKPAGDAWGVGADLPAYSGEVAQATVLAEIYRQRSIELFMSGLRLEDSRRFGRPGPNAGGEERSRNYYPYPFTERDNNPNTPPDPAI
ncbi:MAG: RagB/SusD family nutrient uptake outer membrane protein, partial [Ferruginibacter sp.]|nr:RagB/SusD family nutrient uptake outer membrane protein [Cytophagales bacterium]